MCPSRRRSPVDPVGLIIRGLVTGGNRFARSVTSLNRFLRVLRFLVHRPSIINDRSTFFQILHHRLRRINTRMACCRKILITRNGGPRSLVLSTRVSHRKLLYAKPGRFRCTTFVTNGRDRLANSSISRRVLGAVRGHFRKRQIRTRLPCAKACVNRTRVIHSCVYPRHGGLVFRLSKLRCLRPNAPVTFLSHLRFRSNCVSTRLSGIIDTTVVLFLFHYNFRNATLFATRRRSNHD